jgi:hypothetical protein
MSQPAEFFLGAAWSEELEACRAGCGDVCDGCAGRLVAGGVSRRCRGVARPVGSLE